MDIGIDKLDHTSTWRQVASSAAGALLQNPRFNGFSALMLAPSFCTQHESGTASPLLRLFVFQWLVSQSCAPSTPQHDCYTDLTLLRNKEEGQLSTLKMLANKNINSNNSWRYFSWLIIIMQTYFKLQAINRWCDQFFSIIIFFYVGSKGALDALLDLKQKTLACSLVRLFLLAVFNTLNTIQMLITIR